MEPGSEFILGLSGLTRRRWPFGQHIHSSLIDAHQCDEARHMLWLEYCNDEYFRSSALTNCPFVEYERNLCRCTHRVGGRGSEPHIARLACRCGRMWMVFRYWVLCPQRPLGGLALCSSESESVVQLSLKSSNLRIGACANCPYSFSKKIVIEQVDNREHQSKPRK